jgi:hypothetical protein
MAAGVLRPGRDTPTNFFISWPETGLCPPLAGIFFLTQEKAAAK